MKKLMLLLIFLSTPVMAVEPITGAFGFKLGDVFKGFKKEDVEAAIKDKYNPGVLYYRFKPDVIDDFWTSFSRGLHDSAYVYVTLDKGLIYSIRANVWLGFNQCGSVVMNRLEQEVSKKYGPPTESRVLFVDTSTNSPAIANWWIQYKDGKEFRAVRTGCTQVSIPQAYVRFYDLFVKWEDIRKGR